MGDYSVSVKNAGNTCYMSSLLMSLFYKFSENDEILMKCSKEKKRALKLLAEGKESKEDDIISMLQYLIRAKFLDKVRAGTEVTEKDMNELRFGCHALGWMAKESTEILKQQDVNEFFGFLLDKLDGPLITLTRKTIFEKAYDGKESEKGENEKLSFVTLQIPEGKDVIHMRKLFKLWLYHNEVTMKRKIKGKETEIKGINIYGIKGIPKMLFFSVNRFNTKLERLNTIVEIQKVITPFESSNDERLSEARWKFHSAICHQGTSLYGGHYYSLLSLDDGFYMFNDLMNPSMKRIKLTKSASTTETIKRQVVFLIYELDEKSIKLKKD